MQFSRILTAVLFTTHLMVGCCGHHAHACEDQGQNHSTPVHATACPGANSEGHSGHSHPGAGDCKGEQCSFVLAASHADGQANVQYLQSPAMLLLNDGSSLLDGYSEQSLFLNGRLLLPVRLHLANQVLLI